MLTTELVQRLCSEGEGPAHAWDAGWSRARRAGKSKSTCLGEAHIHMIVNKLGRRVVVIDETTQPLPYARMTDYKPGWAAQVEPLM